MSSKVVTVSSVGQVGVTFLDWSLHWLAGDSEVYNVDTKSWTTIPENPTTNNNAHLHPKNHPDGHGGFLHDLQILKSISTNSFHSIYAAPMHIPRAVETLGLYHIDPRHPDISQWFKTAAAIDYAQIFTGSTPVIFVGVEDHHSWYQLLSMSRSETLEYLGYHQWHYNNPNQTVWDQRETIALQLPQVSAFVSDQFVDFSRPHLWVSVEDLWYNTADLVQDCLDYIGIKIDHSRWDTWNQAHQSWQQIQKPMLRFTRNLDHIVKAVVNGWDYPLWPMTLLEEAIIQHHLIYQHNVNIRNWKLEHFPDNTNKLHQLLEKNQHPL